MTCQLYNGIHFTNAFQMNFFSVEGWSYVYIKFVYVTCSLEQSPLGKLFKASHLLDVLASNRHYLGIRLTVNLCVTDGTKQLHRLACFLSFQESVDIDGNICLGKVLSH